MIKLVINGALFYGLPAIIIGNLVFCTGVAITHIHGSNIRNQNNNYDLSTHRMDTNSFNMELTRILDAPLEWVWRAWSEDSLVKQWWGPRGFTAPIVKMDFRVGGKSLVCMKSPDGFEIYNTWTYTQLIPKQRIEFVHHFSDKDGNTVLPQSIGMPPGIPDSVPHLITFNATDDKKTAISIVEYGYANRQIAELSKAGMNQCLDKMEEALRKFK